MIEVSDTSFDLSQSLTYTLSIRLIPSGFCFSFFDSEKRLVRYVEVGEDKVKGEAFLQKRYASVFYLVDSNRYTLLPVPAFQKENQSLFWNLNFGRLEADEELRYDEVRLTGIVNLYAVKKREWEQVAALFAEQQVRCVHRQSVQMTIAVMRNKQANRRQFFVYMRENEFDVLLLDMGQVILANTFTYRNTNDFLYFTLNVFNQLRIDPFNTEVCISGSESGVETEQLSKYIEKVRDDDFLQKEIPTTIMKSSVSKEIIKKASTLINLPFSVS